MRITMIGTGYVGLVTGACFSEFGVDVTCVDKDKSKIDRLKQGEIPIFEPGLDAYVARNVAAGHLHFTTDLSDAVANSDVVFIAVGTPTSRRGEGHADISYVLGAAQEVAQHLKGYTVVVTKSTVPVGTGREVFDIIRKTNPTADFDIASNPEFLREGSAIEDFMRPDRVVVGVDTERAGDMLRALYKPLYLRDTPIVVTGIETAELAKYAANAFLATKITFINDIANLCEQVGGNVQDIARAMGLDKRIGGKFLHPGPGFGGSCFPKDTLAFARTGRDSGAPQRIVEQVVAINEDRKVQMAEKIQMAAGGDLKGKTVAILGVTFKPNTDDMRESPSLVILPWLQEAGAKIRAYDPEGMGHAAEMIPGVTWCKNAYEAAEKADVVAILTEWNEFRALNFERLGGIMAAPVMVDMRNIYNIADLAGTGFDYYSIGRKPVFDAQAALAVVESTLRGEVSNERLIRNYEIIAKEQQS